MSERFHKWAVRRLPERLAYRYAETFGEHPTCSECDSAAVWILSPEGEARCLMHSGEGPFNDVYKEVAVGMLRDVKPLDHFGDGFEMDP